MCAREQAKDYHCNVYISCHGSVPCYMQSRHVGHALCEGTLRLDIVGIHPTFADFVLTRNYLH